MLILNGSRVQTKQDLTYFFHTSIPFFVQISKNSNVFSSEIEKISVKLSKQLIFSTVPDVKNAKVIPGPSTYKAMKRDSKNN